MPSAHAAAALPEKPNGWVEASRPTGLRRRVGAFNRYIRLISAANSDLSVILVTLGEQVAQMEIKDAWLTTILLFGTELERVQRYVLWETNAEAADDADRAGTRARALKVLRRLIAGEDWADEIGSVTDGPDHEQLARSVPIGLAWAITGQLSAHWMQLQALEAVVAEISEELREEALEPPSREIADGLALRMRALAEKPKMYEPDYALPEPDETALGLMRRFIEHAQRGD